MVGEGAVGVGVVGAGVISDIYLRNLTSRFAEVNVVAIADLIQERAQARADAYGIEALTIPELLAESRIELVLNLTIPLAHAEVALNAVSAGKSVYNEKPLTATREQGQQLLKLAAEKGVLVGGAPDTFLGAGYQTARDLIDEGVIGRPIAATALMYTHGHESWHPDPAFYYQPGAGPMFDMGPYYVTALVSLLGSVKRVSSSAGVSFAERTITSQPKHGETITVNTPTHIVATLDFENGAIASVITSFDVYDTTHSQVVIFGTEGTLRLPDPNGFGGEIQVLRGNTPKEAPLSQGNALAKPQPPVWESVPLRHGFESNSRGLGVADLARAIRAGDASRANGALAYHVLDVMQATLDSSEQGKHMEIQSRVERPEPLGEVIVDQG